jgi:hypothetical protein
MMNEKRLTEAITEGGIPWINFFNGRLLSGEDLSKEQNSNLEGRRRLGRAIGEGVAQGLEVSISKGVNTRETPYVLVEAGLAINRQGQTLWLESPTKVKLGRPVNAETGVVTEAAFDDCQPLQPGVYVAKAGLYLLTIAPARKNEGRAAVSGLDNIIARCNTHHAVEGVQFRLIQLGFNEEELKDTDHLRNQVAYRCFGIDDTAPAISFPVDPLGATSPRQTLLDDLRPRLLTDCDVPLAIINWTTLEGIKFVDMWSVRRRVFSPSAEGRWDAVLGERRRSEGEAMFLQFQEHLESLNQPELNPGLVVATAQFERLPPIGVIPITTESSAQGFDYRKFFQDQTYREPVFIEGARFERLVRESVSYPPLDLGSGELIWLYQVRQNTQPIESGSSVGPAPPYLIFSSGHMPFYGEARFDVNRYNYSNYSSAYD